MVRLAGMERQEKLNEETGAPAESHREIPVSSIEDLQARRPNRRIVLDEGLLRKKGLLAPETHARHIADQYRIIKRPILKLAREQFADENDHMNVVMIGSALSGDGKTFNAINTALSIANENDTSVVLVDADVVKPHISQLFGLSNELGFVDLLRSGETNLDLAAIQTSMPGLSIIPAGQIYEYATELLASDLMAEAVHKLSRSVPNRIVIFDSPPLLQAAESRVLASRMGQIALVVCADKTPRPAVTAAIEGLESEKPLNLILNRAGYMFGANAYGGYPYGYGPRPS